MNTQTSYEALYCNGICISPNSVELDALRLMSYSNSVQKLLDRSEICNITGNILEDNLFTEVISLVTSMALRCRLWVDIYKKDNVSTYSRANERVGIRVDGDSKKHLKKISLTETISFLAHAEGYWLFPGSVLSEEFAGKFKSADGGYVGFKVPAENQNLDSAYTKVINDIISRMPESVEVDFDYYQSSILDELVREKAQIIHPDKQSRTYIISLDEFACAICKMIRVCVSCAGSPGKIKLTDECIPIDETYTPMEPEQVNPVLALYRDKRNGTHIVKEISDLMDLENYEFLGEPIIE